MNVALPTTTFRGIAAATLLAAAIAHVPVIPEHLKEAPYMGAAFIAFTVVATSLACGVAVTGRRSMHIATMLLCGAAIVTYVFTRTVALPELSDDVGNWAEPLGVISVATEMIAIVASGLALTMQRCAFHGLGAADARATLMAGRPYFA